MPAILPPPETMDHDPPTGVPVRLLVWVSQMAEVLVVLLAAPGGLFTVAVTAVLVGVVHPSVAST